MDVGLGIFCEESVEGKLVGLRCDRVERVDLSLTDGH